MVTKQLLMKPVQDTSAQPVSINIVSQQEEHIDSIFRALILLKSSPCCDSLSRLLHIQSCHYQCSMGLHAREII